MLRKKWGLFTTFVEQKILFGKKKMYKNVYRENTCSDMHFCFAFWFIFSLCYILDLNLLHKCIDKKVTHKVFFLDMDINIGLKVDRVRELRI